MTTNEYAKCPRCGRYDLKGFVQGDWVHVYCPRCHKLVVVKKKEGEHD